MPKKDQDEPDLSKPDWLESYANSGSQDFFGFQFLRQTKRRLLLGRAATNQFQTAKPLLYYPAILLEFRKTHNLTTTEALPENLKGEWSRWYRIAHYLFVTYQFQKYGELPDAGFLAAQRATNMLLDRELDPNEKFQIEPFLKDLFAEAPNNFGYFVQFWSGPMGYYRAVTHLRSCQVGALGPQAFALMSKQPAWNELSQILRSGSMTMAAYERIGAVLDVNELLPSELELLHRMLFDLDGMHKESAENYRASFEQVAGLLEKPEFKDASDVRLGHKLLHCYLHRFYQELPPANEMELVWRLFCASYPFELGIVGLFKDMATRFPSVTSVEKVREVIIRDVESWLNRNGLKDGPPSEVCKQFLFTRVQSFDDLSSSIEYVKSQVEGSWVEGYVLGYIACQVIQPPESTHLKSKFLELTDPYYFFNPHSVFRSFDNKGTFVESFTTFASSSFVDQHNFALERLGLGQNPKFLTSPDTDLKTIEFLVLPERIDEKLGLVGFLEGTLRLWISARLLSEEADGQIKVRVRP